MRKLKSFLVISIIILTTACSVLSSPAPAPQRIPLSEADVPRVTVEEAKAAIESGAAVIVDVRSVQAYEASHIEGSISIPLNEIETNPNLLTLEKDQWIVTYCT